MSQIEVPDWVVEAALLGGFQLVCEHEGVEFSEDEFHNGRNASDAEARHAAAEMMKAALTAALGAWVVPAGFMDAKAEFMLPRPGRCVLSSQTVLVRDAYEGRNLPLYTLRQEKPE